MTVLLVLFCLVLSCLARELQMQIADGPVEMVFISLMKLFPCTVLFGIDGIDVASQCALFLIRNEIDLCQSFLLFFLLKTFVTIDRLL